MRLLTAQPRQPPPFGYRAASALFLAGGLAALILADIKVSSLHPWLELQRLAAGLLHPEFMSLEARAIVNTVAFAVLGVSLGASAGLALALVFPRSAAVRAICAAVRSVHELFWALMLMQVTGLSPLTGILAIALP